MKKRLLTIGCVMIAALALSVSAAAADEQLVIYTWEGMIPDDLYTVPYGAGIPLIVYDPSMVDIEITGYNSLWDESLVDSVAITANYRVINGITLITSLSRKTRRPA